MCGWNPDSSTVVPGWKKSLWPLLLLTPLVLLGACAKRDAPVAPATPSIPQVLRLSQRNEPADLDPARATLPDEFFIIRALSEGLLIPGATGKEPRAGAAERHDISADGLTYTFHLRAGAQWSNGEPVTADDFVASYRRILTPATAAPKADLFFAVKNARAFQGGQLIDFTQVGFAAPTPNILVITLQQATPRFLQYVASGPWMPVNPRVVAQKGRTWTQPENYVGNGPFVLTEWRPAQHIIVRRNPRYHRPAAVRLGEVQFLRFDSGDTEDRAYRAGQVDVTMAVPANKLETYARERRAELHRAPLAETRYLSFNTQRAPLNDARVRRALTLALDREKLVRQVMLGGQEAAYRMVPPTIRASSDVEAVPAGTTKFEPAEARRLLAAAGFPGGKDFPALELTGWSVVPILEAIQEMWRRELGVTIGIAVREAKVHISAMRDGAYDIGFATQIPDVADPVAVLSDYTSASAINFPQWHEPEFDQLVNAAATTIEPGRQSELILAAEARLAAACAVAPLYYNAKNWLMSTHVKGWQEDALWTRHYLDLWIESPVRK